MNASDKKYEHVCLACKCYFTSEEEYQRFCEKCEYDE